MESALDYKDSDIKYVFVRVPESCLKSGWTTCCQPKSVPNILFEISRFWI